MRCTASRYLRVTFLAMLDLSHARVRVDNADRAASFYAAVFGWELRILQSSTAREATVMVSRTAETFIGTCLVLTDDPSEPNVRLGFTVSDLHEAATRIEGLGGQIEHADEAAVRCLDDQGTPLLLGVGDREHAGQASQESRGGLGVLFVFANAPDRAAEFYRDFAGWAFEAIGRDKDILFIKDGPPVGIRPASRAPAGRSGEITFHISVVDPGPVTTAIKDHGGQVGPTQSAGLYATKACRDDQGTAFSLWYRPVGT